MVPTFRGSPSVLSSPGIFLCTVLARALSVRCFAVAFSVLSYTANFFVRSFTRNFMRSLPQELFCPLLHLGVYPAISTWGLSHVPFPLVFFPVVLTFQRSVSLLVLPDLLLLSPWRCLLRSLFPNGFFHALLHRGFFRALY